MHGWSTSQLVAEPRKVAQMTAKDLCALNIFFHIASRLFAHDFFAAATFRRAETFRSGRVTGTDARCAEDARRDSDRLSCFLDVHVHGRHNL